MQNEAARVREGQKKLTLVLDLDHTLLNSSMVGARYYTLLSRVNFGWVMMVVAVS